MISSLRSSKFPSRSQTLTAITLLATCFGLALSVEAQSPTPTPTPTAPTYSRVLVFGDSLSDVGNLRHRMSQRGVRYPSPDFNYTDGRFTDGTDTDPASQAYTGVWHEQLSQLFLKLPTSTASLDGGDSFAFGGATTEDGTQDYSIFNTPFGDYTVTIDNMGQQVDDYVTRRTVDPGALFVIWGGGNDLFNDDSDSNVNATAGRVSMLLSKLAQAGARHFLIPNVPPLGGVPRYSDDEATQMTKNRASAAYRDKLLVGLRSTVNSLAAQGIQIDLNQLDTWSLFLRFVSDPARYGFTDMQHSAQGQSVNPDTFLFWDDIHPTTAAHYRIAEQANRVLAGAVVPPARAVNLSTRANVGAGENLSVGGFIVQGTKPKRVILRGVGPSLASSGVAAPLPNPKLELYDANHTLLASNDNWKDTQAAEISATGVAPKDDLESAIVRTLQPGSYTVQLSASDARPGVGLVEMYDLAPGAPSTLANVSTRAPVGIGEDVMIAGVMIGSGGEAITVVRALGPSLSQAGVVAPLQDPMLELYDSNGTQIATNDNWRDGQPLATKATLLVPTDDRESTIVASLAPGSYTAVVRGKDNTTGVGLVEVYRVP